MAEELTFLFTDIEDSTVHQHNLGDERWAEVLGRHNELVASAVGEHQGWVFGSEGDGQFAAFHSAADGVRAALTITEALAGEHWPAPIRVRLGLNTGKPVRFGADFVGLCVTLAARVRNAARGGQVLLSHATAEACRGADGFSVVPWGAERLKGFGGPQELFEATLPGRPRVGRMQTATRPATIPLFATAVVGRALEFARIAELIRSGSRFVTITGPGGIGKTRLAAEAASRIAEQFEEVFFVRLADVDPLDPVTETVWSVVARPLTHESSSPEDLGRAIGRRKVLLVLDNAEHLVSCRQEIEALIGSTERLAVLVTSREPLSSALEVLVPLDGLETPDAERVPPERVANYAAARLFLDRLHASGAPEPGPGELRTIAEICSLLDGSPLAIELWAASVHSLGLNLVLERVRAGADSPAGVLPTHARHETVGNAIRSTFDVLAVEEKSLLAQLSFFAGGARLETLTEIVASEDGTEASVVESTVMSLVAKSLVQVRTTPGAGQRLHMHRTLRNFVQERAREDGSYPGLVRRFVIAEAGMALRFERSLRSSRHAQTLELIRAELENFEAAGSVSQASPGLGASCLEMYAALGQYWWDRSSTRGAELLERFLSEGALSTRAKALYWLSALCRFNSRLPDSRRYAEEYMLVLRASGAGRRAMAAGHELLSSVATAEGDYDGARRDADRSVALARESGDGWVLANMLGSVADAATLQGDRDAARAALLESLELFRNLGDERSSAHPLLLLGECSYAERDFLGARLWLEECAVLHRRSGNGVGAARCLSVLGRAAWGDGERSVARQCIRESLDIALDHRSRWELSWGLGALAIVFESDGDAEAALRAVVAARHLARAAHRQRVAVIEGEDAEREERLAASLDERITRRLRWEVQRANFDDFVAFVEPFDA